MANTIFWAELSGKPKIEIIHGDITLQDTDAVVNASSNDLRLGGTVDSAIHRAAGPALREACNQVGRCETGEAFITPGFNLVAKFIIHTVGPQYGKANGKEAELLANCYRNCLQMADNQQLTSISFPSISTGVYGYPVKDAARVAALAVGRYFFEPEHQQSGINKINFVLYAEEKYWIYQDIFTEIFHY